MPRKKKAETPKVYRTMDEVKRNLLPKATESDETLNEPLLFGVSDKVTRATFRRARAQLAQEKKEH